MLEVLKSALKRNVEVNTRLNKIREVLDNPKSIIPIYEIYMELYGLTKFNQIYKKVSSVNTWGEDFGVTLATSLPYTVDFDVIADSFSELEVSGGTIYAVCKYRIERVFEGITFRIDDYSKAELPEEYVEVLEMLGKIKTEEREAETQTYISCEI